MHDILQIKEKILKKWNVSSKKIIRKINYFLNSEKFVQALLWRRSKYF